MRRRPFRPDKPIRFGLPRPRKSVPPKLREAHRLFELGKLAEAAVLYEELAEGAEKKNIPQAPYLYLRSGDS